ncbi:hypothetical protein RhiirC2_787909 [Rhizophagus irregularis]|uniref:Uncharacterized protein n=1 Tax=Rhizophagus irregularis TaxID=588596 RepID=A0A2N1MR90_9GLOM|nr:hypothetical protein RhiirC2_787909 [Rhizophagus irregularis]
MEDNGLGRAYEVVSTERQEWYENKKELLESVENLYKLYFELSKEERIITEEEINNTRDDLLREDYD